MSTTDAPLDSDAPDPEPEEPRVRDVRYLRAWAKWTSEMQEHYPDTDILRTIWLAAEEVAQAALEEHLQTSPHPHGSPDSQDSQDSPKTESLKQWALKWMIEHPGQSIAVIAPEEAL